MISQRRLMELRAMSYEDYLKTPEWQAKKEQALERDGHRCRVCNTNKDLNVHHRFYLRGRGNEILDDLTTLCRGCHETFHQQGKLADYRASEHYAPIQKERKKEDAVQMWEDYLIGQLIQNPGLCLHVCGIVSEDDFLGEDTRALYSLLYSIHQRGSSQSGELTIPNELQEAANRARERAASKPSNDGAGQVKEVVQTAIRLKRFKLIRLNTELKDRIQKIAEAGDKQLYRQTLQEFLALRQQRQVLDAATHLQG